MAACKVCWQGWLKLLRPSTTLSLDDERLVENEQSSGSKPAEPLTKLLQLDPSIAGVHKGEEVVRRDAEGLPAATNPGSVFHGTGQCQPCAWFWKSQGCRNDKDCKFCHLCPVGEMKTRKKAKAIARRSSSGLSAASPAVASGGQPSSTRVLSLSQML